MIKQLLILFLLQMKKNGKYGSDDSNDLQESRDSYDDVTVDGYYYFSKNNQNNHVCINYSYGFLGMCNPPEVEPDDISEANSHNYFAIGVVEDK